MKLLHLLPGFDPAMGGTLAFVKAWVKASEEEGIISHILALQPEQAESLSEGYELIRIPSQSGVYRYSSKLVPWLKEHLNEYDRVIIHGVWQYHTLGAWRVLRNHSIPYYLFPHGMLDDWFRRTYPLKHLKKCLYWWLFESKVLKGARAVIYTSEEEQRSSSKVFYPYEAKDKIVPLGIHDPRKEKSSDQELFFKIYPSCIGKKIVLFLGRLHPKKGCDLLIRAFATALHQDRDWVLVMAGPEGEQGYEEKLSALAKEQIEDESNRVIWTGGVEGEMKWSLIRSAHCFCLPSHQENFGIAVVESLACGTPVLISDQINIWKTIERGKGGMVSSDTVEGMEGLLKKWSQISEQELNGYRLNARKIFEENFRIEETVSKLNQLIAYS